MNCCDEIQSLIGLSEKQVVIQLNKERNNFAESRQKWIQAAFNLAHHEDYTLFNKLVEEELCEDCNRSYTKLIN